MKEWPHGRQTPDNNLMRFVSRRGFLRDAVFLDIGCGEGANLDELLGRGFKVIGIDKEQQGYPHEVADIQDFHPVIKFDLIYDINTLCHVEFPPIEKIKSWLKPHGFFFCICPSDGAWSGVAEGKEFTRFLSLNQLEGLLFPFSRLETYKTFSPDFRGNYLDSWIAEARP